MSGPLVSTKIFPMEWSEIELWAIYHLWHLFLLIWKIIYFAELYKDLLQKIFLQSKLQLSNRYLSFHHSSFHLSFLPSIQIVVMLQYSKLVTWKLFSNLFHSKHACWCLILILMFDANTDAAADVEVEV